MEYATEFKVNKMESKINIVQDQMERFKDTLDEFKRENDILHRFILFKLDNEEYERFKAYLELQKEFAKNE